MIVGDIVRLSLYPDRQSQIGIIVELIRDDPKFFRVMWADGELVQTWGYDLEVVKEKRYLIDELGVIE